MAFEPPILNVHTPTSSFAIVHSITQDSLESLYDTLGGKIHSLYPGQRVGPGWLKYEYNDSIWNLDDDSDYTIFVWRQQQTGNDQRELTNGLVASTSSVSSTATDRHTVSPTLHLYNPAEPLPEPPNYVNPSYYLFHPSRSAPLRARSFSPRPKSTRSKASKRGTIRSKHKEGSEDSVVPRERIQKEFDKFHSENGVRTVLGSIGPVQNVRMLLKAGYRHVYISRKFAQKHGFIPADAAPGHYGYGGLVNIGTWPITLSTSASITDTQPYRHVASTHARTDVHGLLSPQSAVPRAPSPVSILTHHTGATKRSKLKEQKSPPGGPKVTNITVYLSEEPHFDVVLGRSFFERRQIQTNAVDPTDIVCLDTGEKVDCELVILKDGRGEIVTVT